MRTNCRLRLLTCRQPCQLITDQRGDQKAISFRTELYAKQTALLTYSRQSSEICWLPFGRLTSPRPYTHPMERDAGA